MKKHAPRDRTRPLYVYVNGAERSEINAKAKAAGMTISAYLRAAATNKRILSALDRKVSASPRSRAVRLCTRAQVA